MNTISETNYENMHMDEEDATKTAEIEVEDFVCETKQDNINAQGLHCNVDGVDDGESHCEKHMWMMTTK